MPALLSLHLPTGRQAQPPGTIPQQLAHQNKLLPGMNQIFVLRTAAIGYLPFTIS